MNKKLIIVAGGIGVLVAIAGLFLLGKKAATPPVPGTAATVFAEAKKLHDQGNLPAAKAQYQKLVSEYPNVRDVLEWQKKIEDINMQLLFSPTITPQSVEYEIKPGDSLEKIARQFRTTAALIMRSNNLANDNIFPGKKIKVWNAPFSIVVDKSQNILMLKSGEEVIKTYTVATGSSNCTPVGNFKIVEKIVNPPWYKPGGGMVPPGNPQNILGSRWLGLDKEGYGIHGTTEPQSLGKQSTAGCIRMANTDVEELFSIVPQGTEVTIVD